MTQSKMTVEITEEEYNKLLKCKEYFKAMDKFSKTMAYPIHFDHCCVEGCEAYEVSDHRDDDHYYHCKWVSNCDLCMKTFCDKHMSDYECPSCKG